jgi:subtilisin family serine protease
MISFGLFHKLHVILAIILTSSSQEVAASDDVVQKMGVRGLAKEMTYIVSFKDTDVAPAERCAAIAKATRGEVRHVFDHVLNGCSLTLPAAQAEVAIAALNGSPAVNIIEKNHDVFLAYQPVHENNIQLKSQLQPSAGVGAPSSWGLDRVNQCALPLDNITTKQDATGVKVFVIDTGIYAEHEDFANGVIGSDDCHFSVFPGDNPLTDGHGHG